MFGEPNSDVFELTDALDALGELEQNTSQAILAKRSSKRVDIHCAVEIRPGNSSERFQFTINGMTADISNGGSKIILPRPILPGDIYWITLKEKLTNVGSLLARCRRCVMVNENAFEVGLRFFEDIDVSGILFDSECKPEPHMDHSLFGE